MKNRYKKVSIILLIILTYFSLGLRAEDDDGDHDDHDEEEYSHLEEESNANELREDIREFLEDEEGQELKRFIEKEMPKGTVSWIKQLISEDPYEAYAILEHVMETQEEYLELREIQPDIAKDFLDYSRSEAAAYILANQIEKSGEADSEGLRKQLRKELEKAFDLKLSLQKAELAELEDEVDELRALLEKRETARETVIDRRFNELTGQDEHLEW